MLWRGSVLAQGTFGEHMQPAEAEWSAVLAFDASASVLSFRFERGASEWLPQFHNEATAIEIRRGREYGRIRQGPNDGSYNEPPGEWWRNMGGFRLSGDFYGPDHEEAAGGFRGMFAYRGHMHGTFRGPFSLKPK